jgi:hypothetical protein
MFICIRAEYAAVARLGMQYGAATGALILDQSFIGRHLLGAGKSALWTGDDGMDLYQRTDLMKPQFTISLQLFVATACDRILIRAAADQRHVLGMTNGL